MVDIGTCEIDDGGWIITEFLFEVEAVSVGGIIDGVLRITDALCDVDVVGWKQLGAGSKLVVSVEEFEVGLGPELVVLCSPGASSSVASVANSTGACISVAGSSGPWLVVLGPPGANSSVVTVADSAGASLSVAGSSGPELVVLGPPRASSFGASVAGSLFIFMKLI